MEVFGIVFALFAIVALIVAGVQFIQRQEKLDEIGTVQCKRCKHQGRAKYVKNELTDQVSIVCSNCGGPDWEKVT